MSFAGDAQAYDVSASLSGYPFFGNIGTDLDTCLWSLVVLKENNYEANARVVPQLGGLLEKVTVREARMVVLSPDSAINQKDLKGFMNDSRMLIVQVSVEIATQVEEKLKADYSSEYSDEIFQISLFDKSGAMRGVYNATEYSKIKEMSEDLKALKAAEFVPRKDDKEAS